MENIEINLSGKTYTFIPPSEELDQLFWSSSSSTAHIAPIPAPSSGMSIWSAGTSPSFPPAYLDFVYNIPEQLVTYSEDEILNKILNEMADEVEGKVKQDYKIPTGIDVVDPYYFTARTYTSTTTTPFTTTTPSSWRIIR